MSVVVDSSVLVVALTDGGTLGAWAERMVARAPIYAPELVQAETSNILRRLERARRIPTLEAGAAFEDLLQLDLAVFPFAPFAERIWQLRHAVTSYDAWYVALAEALQLPLATLDRRLARAKGPKCRFLLPE